MTPGKKPASATPSRNRSDRNDAVPAVHAIAPETRPQEIMMRAIQRLAPKRSSARLLGTSSRK